MPGGDSTYEIAAYENDTQTLQLPSLYTAKDTFPLDRNQYFGRVVYIPGRGIDQPIGVTRINYEYQHDDTIGAPIPWKVAGPITTMPFWNRNGDAPLGAFTDGSRALCHPPTSPTDCVTVVWSYLWSAYDRRRGIFGENWFGTILENKRDKSNLSYSRNRYYDPQTGRFTQEDPIGLAGGLNLYGFASGDPVNFSDPFGLCTKEDGWKDCNFSGPQARAVLASLGGAAPAIKHEVATFVPKNIISALAGIGLGKVLGAVASRLSSQTVVHFTSAEGAAAIEESGALRANSFVTTPEAVVGRTAGVVEDLLELQPGRGAMNATLRVPADALKIPVNGPLTSGGVPQFQLTRPIPIDPGTFVPTPH